MKIILFLIAVLSNCIYSQAQDVLIKRSGEETLVKVMELTPEQVKYKRFDYQEGPVISIPNQEVAEIKFGDGTVQKFPAAPMPAASPVQKPKPTLKHALAVNVLPLLAGSVNFFYDNRFANHPKVALSVGGGIWNQNIPYVTSFDQDLHLTGGVKFFLGESSFYLSPYLKYRHVTGFRNQSWDQAGVGATFGARHVFRGGFLIDTFMGLGGYAINHHTGNLSADYYIMPSTTDLRLGLCIGYAFN